MSTKAVKHNQGKPQWTILLNNFKEELEGVVRVFEYGAEKYDRDNWKQELPEPNFYLDPLYRHLLADGDIDEESGLPHLHHALCCLLMHAWHKEPDE